MKILPFPENEKQTQMLHQLKLGTVMVFLDTRAAGVIVPEQYRNDFQLRLNFDYAFEIDDFKVLPDRLEASLSFNRQRFFCVVPFSAVYLMVSHGSQIGALFPESIPKEMLNFFTLEQRPFEKQKNMSVLDGAAQPAESALATDAESPAGERAGRSTEDGDEAASSKKRGHLRLVK